MFLSEKMNQLHFMNNLFNNLFLIFRKYNTSEISQEFSQLAPKFDNCFLSEYAGLCFLGVAKCNENEADVESLLKGARYFRKADSKRTELGFVNNHEHLEGAYRCYFQALSSLEDSDVVMKTCVIRELTELDQNLNLTSDFNSPCNRIYDLELSANQNINDLNFVAALEKFTEVLDDLVERKCEDLYIEVLKSNEVSRLLLLLLLELPPCRQSPSHIKLLEKYTWNHESENYFDIEMAAMLKTQTNNQDENLVLLLEGLVHACHNSCGITVKEMRQEIVKHHEITMQQNLLLDKIVEKYNPY